MTQAVVTDAAKPPKDAAVKASAVSGFALTTHRPGGRDSGFGVGPKTFGEIVRHDIKDNRVVGSRVIYPGMARAAVIDPSGERVAFIKLLGRLHVMKADGTGLKELARDAAGRISRIRYVLPRHKAASWVGRGRGRKSTRPGGNGVVEFSPLEFLDRLADLVPPPRKHRHRYHGVFAPNHKLRTAVTALAIGNVGKPREAVAGGHADGGQPAEGCCDTQAKPRSHDTSRIAWAKLMARAGEEFPLACPTCGGDIRLIAFRLLSECETIPGLRTLGNLRLLRTSCPRTGADPEDSDTPRLGETPRPR